MSKSDFLEDLAWADFEADLKREEERTSYVNYSLVWNNIRQEKLSWLMVLLERAYMTRQEQAWVYMGIETDSIEELSRKIRFASQYLPTPEPGKQFKLRSKIL